MMVPNAITLLITYNLNDNYIFETEFGHSNLEGILYNV